MDDHISLDNTPNSFNNDYIERVSEREDYIEQSPNSENTEGLTLHEGMIFETQEEAMEAYNQYAYKKYFGIRKGSSYRSSKSKEISRQEFTCKKRVYISLTSILQLMSKIM